MLIPLSSWYDCIRKFSQGENRKVEIRKVEVLKTTNHAIGATQRLKTKSITFIACPNNQTGGPMGQPLTINIQEYTTGSIAVTKVMGSNPIWDSDFFPSLYMYVSTIPLKHK